MSAVRVGIGLLGLVALGVAQEPPAPPSVLSLVEEGRSAMWSSSRWPEARKRFTEALAQPKTWHTPLAQIGLASLARLEGHLPEALDRLEAARKSTARWSLQEPLPRLVRFDLHVESSRCYLALGLGDRAGLELDAAEALAGDPGFARRIALDLARIDLQLALGEVRAANRVAGAVRTQLAIDPGTQEERDLRRLQEGELGFRDLLIRMRLARDPAELATLAGEIERRFAAAEPGSVQRTRLGCDAIAAHAAGGDLAAALVVSRELNRPPFESLQRQAEIQALHLGLLLRAEAPRDELKREHEVLQQLAERLFGEWRAQPLRPGGTGTFHYEARREVLGTLLSADRALYPEEPVRALRHLEAALSLGTLSRRLCPRPIDVAQPGCRPANGGALAFAFAPGVAHLLLSDDEGMLHVEVPLEAGDRDRLADLVRAVDRPPLGEPETEVAAARALAEAIAAKLLPAPVAARLAGWRNVLLVGDEGYVAALQALPIGGVPLGVGKAVAHAPSLSLCQALQQRAAARPPRPADGAELALLADPAIGAQAREKWQVDELALRPEQLDSLSAGLPAARVHRAVREAATAAALGAAEVAGAAQLTIVAHGVEDLRAERAAGIVLAGTPQPTLLRADGVETLKVPPLVALGVCGAAGGPRRLGDDGVHHFGGAFLLAGADRVVLAGGQLAVGATVDLLAAFTRSVRAGTGPAEALRAARAGIQADPARRHPYYWAGLRLLGPTDPAPR